MSLGVLWSGWDDELPLHEASLQLDPPPEQWIAKAAFQTAILKPGQVLYERNFYATESDKPDAPPQTTEEADKEAVKLNEIWPR